MTTDAIKKLGTTAGRGLYGLNLKSSSEERGLLAEAEGLLLLSLFSHLPDAVYLVDEVATKASENSVDNRRSIRIGMSASESTYSSNYPGRSGDRPRSAPVARLLE